MLAVGLSAMALRAVFAAPGPEADKLYPDCDTYIRESAKDRSFGREATIVLNTPPTPERDPVRMHDTAIGFLRFNTSAWTDEAVANAKSITLHIHSATVESPANWKNIQYLELMSLDGEFAGGWDDALTWDRAASLGLTSNVTGDRVPGGIIDPVRDEQSYHLDVTNYVRKRRLLDRSRDVSFKLQKSRQGDSHDLFDKVSAPFHLHSSRASPSCSPWLEIHPQEITTTGSQGLRFKDSGFLSDPMKISDEEFFGAATHSGGEWSTPPLLRYTEFSGLEETKRQALSGNYSEAKAALLGYFRAKSDGNGGVSGGHSPDVRFIEQEIYGADGTFAGEFSVGHEQGRVEVPLSCPLNDAGDLMLFDPDKSPTDMVFSSREADGQLGPHLEIRFADGSKTEVPVARDATIRAGRYGTAPLGKDAVLRVREAGMPLSEETKRTYLSFDLKGVARDKKVAAVALRLHGGGAPPGARSRCYVLRAKPSPGGLDESRLTWRDVNLRIYNYKDPVTGFYGNFNWAYPPDVECIWFSAFTRMAGPALLAMKYKATGDEVYATKALALLLSFHHLRQNRVHAYIDRTFRIPYVVGTTLPLIESTSMTPEAFTAVLKFIHQLARENEPVGAGRFRDNRASGQIAGAIMLAYQFPEIMPATRNNHGDYRGLAVREALDFCGHLTAKDGAYGEAVTGTYVRGVLTNSMQLYDQFKSLGQAVPPVLTEALNNLAKYLINTSYPNGVGVVYGDAGPMDIRPLVASVAERTGDPMLVWYSTRGKEGTMTQSPSKWYPDGGLAMLKTSFLDPDALAIFTNAVNNRSHAHADDLSLDFYAFGRPLLREPGSVSYSPSDPQDGRKTARHNTIAVDGRDQVVVPLGKPSMASIDQFVDGEEAGYIDEHTDANTQQGAAPTDRFRHRRRILLLKASEYAIVSDFIDTLGDDSKPHTYTLTWSPDIRAMGTLERPGLVFATHFPEGANVQVIPASPEELQAELRTDSSVDTVRNDTNGFVVYTRSGVRGDQPFESVLIPTRSGKPPPCTVQSLRSGPERRFASALELELPGNRKGFFLSRHAPAGTVRFGPFETDCAVAYAETAGGGDRYFCASGTFLRNVSTGQDILRAEAGFSDISIRKSGREIRISTASRDKIRVAIPSAVPFASVMINGVPAPVPAVSGEPFEIEGKP